jgi:uncharacterized protein YdhG (YjbR/CyaY superfamily)
MKSSVNNPNEYISELPEHRKEAMIKLRSIILEKLPSGFEESMSYGMIGYGIPHSIYPAGYHCKPEDPVPFLGIASQKNYIAFYHMGIYSYPEILEWFLMEYPKHTKTKLDMGKSCIRFKKPEDIPYDLISELCTKITLEDYLEKYKHQIEKSKKLNGG